MLHLELRSASTQSEIPLRDCDRNDRGHYDLHIFERLPNCGDQRLQIFGEEVADSADAETVCVADLSRVNHKAPLTKELIEPAEIEVRMFRITE